MPLKLVSNGLEASKSALILISYWYLNSIFYNLFANKKLSRVLGLNLGYVFELDHESTKMWQSKRRGK